MDDPYESRTGNTEKLVPGLDPIVVGAGLQPRSLGPKHTAEYTEFGYALVAGVFTASEINRLACEAKRMADDRSIRLSNHSVMEPGSGELRSIFTFRVSAQSSPS